MFNHKGLAKNHQSYGSSSQPECNILKQWG